MSLYQLQKMIRDVNRDPAARAAYQQDKAAFLARYALTPEESGAARDLDIGRLYAMGVHALLLRPFTILHQVPEPDYLSAIRAGS